MRLLAACAALGIAVLSGCASKTQPAGEHPDEAAPTSPTTSEAVAGSPSCADRAKRDVQLRRDVEPILMSGCSGEYCHGLSMSTAARAYDYLVNQPSMQCDDLRPLVVPGNPGKSYVIDKVLGRNLCGGHPMPRGLANRLSPEEVGTLYDWICEGAPND